MALCEKVSEAIEAMRSTVNRASRTAMTVAGSMNSSSEPPEACKATLDVMATSSMRCSDSWVSTLKVRIESMSSPNRSMRSGSSSE